MTITEWVPAMVAAATVVGQGFLLYQAAARHERWLQRHDAEIGELKEYHAILKDREKKEEHR